MGFYGTAVLPRLINATAGVKALDPLRRRVCAGLAGDVVEIGFGSGLNVPFYPAAVTRVAAVEPSDLGWRLAGERLRSAAVPVERAGLDGQSLPLPDGSYDAALSTWTLCSIPDAAAALAELRRVLKPGGTLHFLEHGLAPDERVRRWRLPPHPADRRPGDRRGLYRHRTRGLLPGGNPEGHGGRLPRRGGGAPGPTEAY